MIPFFLLTIYADSLTPAKFSSSRRYEAVAAAAAAADAATRRQRRRLPSDLPRPDPERMSSP